MRGVRPARSSVAAVLCTLLSIFAFAQTQTGVIAGTIRDVQGAVIVNAVIQLKNTATGEKRATASDSSGKYGLAFPPRPLQAKRALSGVRGRAFQ